MSLDVATPIQSVIPSADAAVYTALAATNAPQSARKIASQGGLAHNTARTILRRLEQAGITVEGPGGWVLNRDHVAVESILALTQLRGTLFDRISAWAEEHIVPAPLLLGVYGSAARQDGGPESDIDLVIVWEQPDADIEEMLVERVAAWSGNAVSVMSWTPDHIVAMREHDEALLRAVRGDVVVFLGSRSVLS